MLCLLGVVGRYPSLQEVNAKADAIDGRVASICADGMAGGSRRRCISSHRLVLLLVCHRGHFRMDADQQPSIEAGADEARGSHRCGGFVCSLGTPLLLPSLAVLATSTLSEALARCTLCRQTPVSRDGG